MKCSLANPNIAPHIKETLLSYYEHGYLDKFYTSYFFNKDSVFNQLIERYFPSATKELKRRSVETVPPANVSSRPVPEILRVVSSRKFKGTVTDKIWEWSELGFDNWVAKHLSPNLDWVHTCEHAGLHTLQKAKQLGIMSIHEQPSLHHHFFSGIIKRQTALYPEFDSGIAKLLHDENSVRRNARRDEELLVADFILCNSSFTKKTLVQSGLDASKIITVPLGFPNAEMQSPKVDDRKLTFMYAGNIAFGKGIHILLEAWKGISTEGCELWLIGNVQLPKSMLEELPDNIKFLPRLPHLELMKLYTEADVFIHPTLADGFGMVVAEAMSRGIPVITTHNSGAADLISEKVDGLVVMPESVDAIQEAIRWSIDHRMQLRTMGARALEKASKYPWAAYRQKLIKTILEKKGEWNERKRSA